MSVTFAPSLLKAFGGERQHCGSHPNDTQPKAGTLGFGLFIRWVSRGFAVHTNR